MTRPVLSVSEAAKACQVAAKTITRRLPALQEHGASKDSDGHWRIPIEALLAVGLRPGKPTSPDTVQEQRDMSQATVQAELTALRHRAELAEALLAAERRTSEALSLALRALTAGAPAATPTPAPTPDIAPETPPRRRRWWQSRG